MLARIDARYFQIVLLASLLLYGLLILRFDVSVERATIILCTVLATQLFFSKLYKLPAYEPKSALISGISLCLLLRCDSVLLAIFIAFVSIASKFLVRYRGKHFLNPTNFGLGLGLLCFDGVWISPGQWGSTAVLSAYFLCIGLLVVVRSLRSDVALAFLGSYAGLLLWRALWLGDPLEIPLHQLESGALLLFSFFMISDPRTTPDSRLGRVIFAVTVAVIAYYIRFKQFNPDSLILALFFTSFLTPLIDMVLRSSRFEWWHTVKARHAS